MKLETNAPVAGEPEGGWVTGQPLIDTQVLELVLCRFTGSRVTLDEPCQARLLGRHPDVDCPAIFYSADALEAKVMGGTEFPRVQQEVRAPYPMGEATGTQP